MKPAILLLSVTLCACSDLPKTWSEDEIREIATDVSLSDPTFEENSASDMRQMKNSIDALEGRVSTLESELSLAQSEISDLRGDIANHELLYDHR